MLCFLLLNLGANAAPPPLPQAHSHNDYLHTRPLLDALEQGFCSVEADIHLVGGKLLVAHDLEKAQAERTLRALYLDPLAARARQNGGRVFTNGPAFTLLIDIKSEAETTYAALKTELSDFKEILTEFTTSAIRTNAITVVISGNRPIATIAAAEKRLAAIDGRLPDLSSNAPLALIPLVSDNWAKHFQWRGQGPLPASEKQRLRETVAQAHQQGRRIRFWATPDTVEAWRELKAAGVDLINTDNLEGLASFLR